jgi:hypothetical protein
MLQRRNRGRVLRVLERPAHTIQRGTTASSGPVR